MLLSPSTSQSYTDSVALPGNTVHCVLLIFLCILSCTALSSTLDGTSIAIHPLALVVSLYLHVIQTLEPSIV